MEGGRLLGILRALGKRASVEVSGGFGERGRRPVGLGGGGGGEEEFFPLSGWAS